MLLFMPVISTIIVNWNGKHLLDECLGAVRGQTFRDFETIVVDNGSSDGSADYVQTHYPEVKLVALPENRGFTGGNIAGYEVATGDLIVLLNNDTEAHPGWLEHIYKASLVFPDAGSFASKMLYFDQRERIENCGFELSAAGTTEDVGRGKLDGAAWSTFRSVFGACGGAVAYRRPMLQDVGFFDPDFFMIYEDVDLSFRAQLRGYSCVYCPQAMVYHRYRSTIKTRPVLQVFYSQRNIELVYLKDMPLAVILRALPQRLLYEAGAAIYFVLQGRGSAFLLAKLDVLRCLPSILRKRAQVQQRRTVTNAELRTIMRRSGVGSKWEKFRSAWKRSSDDTASLPITPGEH